MFVLLLKCRKQNVGAKTFNIHLQLILRSDSDTRLRMDMALRGIWSLVYDGSGTSRAALAAQL